MNEETRSDEDLMRSFQQGDRSAFEELYRRRRGLVTGFLFRQRLTEDKIQEFTQETFLRMIKGASAFRFESSIKTWLFHIAHNIVVDHARTEQRKPLRSLEEPKGRSRKSLGDQIESREPAPDRSTTAGRLRQEIASAIENLPGEQREVFLLREYGGVPFEEIAVIVGAKEGTVKSRMRYALTFLQRSLAHYTDYARTLP